MPRREEIKDLARLSNNTELSDTDAATIDKQLSHAYVDSILDGADAPFGAVADGGSNEQEAAEATTDGKAECGGAGSDTE